MRFSLIWWKTRKLSFGSNKETTQQRHGSLRESLLKENFLSGKKIENISKINFLKKNLKAKQNLLGCNF